MPLCKICGKPTICNCPYGWRNSACSIEHYQKWMELESGDKMAYKLRASMNNVVYDIKDYIVKDNDIELVTTASDKVINLSDTEYLVVLDCEKGNILKTYNYDGEYVLINKSEYTNVIKYKNNPEIVKTSDIAEKQDSQTTYPPKKTVKSKG